jgi:hypothetical protein
MAIIEVLRMNPPHIGIGFAATSKATFYKICKKCEKYVCGD